MNRFVDKVALVTGGRSGIGKAITERLHKEGARVFTAQRGNDDRFESHACDLADPQSCRLAVKETVARTGRLDVLINNAGMMQESGIEEMSLEDWRRNLDVNLTAPFLMIQKKQHL